MEIIIMEIIIKAEPNEVAELLRAIQGKQEYVNGYVQGIADTIAEREQQKTA